MHTLSYRVHKSGWSATHSSTRPMTMSSCAARHPVGLQQDKQTGRQRLRVILIEKSKRGHGKRCRRAGTSGKSVIDHGLLMRFFRLQVLSQTHLTDRDVCRDGVVLIALHVEHRHAGPGRGLQKADKRGAAHLRTPPARWSRMRKSGAANQRAVRASWRPPGWRLGPDRSDGREALRPER